MLAYNVSSGILNPATIIFLFTDICFTVHDVFVLVLKLEVTEESKRIASSAVSAPPPDNNDVWDFELQRKTEMNVLEEIENLEERICGASLQTKVSCEVRVYCFNRHNNRFTMCHYVYFISHKMQQYKHDKHDR